MADDIYSLLMDESEPDAAARAAAMADMLRRNRGVGGLALLSGDRVLGRFGEALLGQSGQQEQALAGAGQQRSGNVLRSALAAQQQQTALARAGADAENARLNREQRNELARLGRENALKAAAIGAGNKAAQEEFERETGLRKEFASQPEVKEFSGLATSYQNLLSSAKDSSGPGGVATIFNFMKMLDPGVAVMEGDVQLIRSSGGPAAKFANLYEQALSGNPLPASVRDDLIRQATTIYRNRKAQVDALGSQYGTLASDAGVKPERVVLKRTPDIDLMAPATGPARRPQQPRPANTMPLPAGKDRADVLSKMREGQQYSTRMPDGSVRVVMKKGGQIVKVSQSGGK